MKQALRTVGVKLQAGTLHPWHVGLLLGLKNGLICVGVGALVVLSWRISTSWVYLYAALPVLLLLFWLWYSHYLLSMYRHVPIHDSLLIALAGSFPFMLIFCIATILVYWYSFGGDWTYDLMIFFYNTMGISLGAIFLQLTVVTFVFHHPFKRKHSSTYV